MIYRFSWLDQNKKTENPVNKKDKCLQYAVTIALNQEEIGNHVERITKIEPFINKYNRKGKKFPS